MKIAYLMNQHPYASCTFIRREISALEDQGVIVHRFSIRHPELDITDKKDQQELLKTTYILSQSKWSLALNLIKLFLKRPVQWLKSCFYSFKLSQKSDRNLIVNLGYFVEACTLLKLLEALDIKHVHCHFATNPTTVAMLCHTLGGPTYSFTVHGPHEFDKPEAIALGEKIHRAAFVAAISYFTRSQLFRWCHYKHWSKIHVVRCGVDSLFLSQPSTPLPELSNFVCVGRISEQKGHLILIEAVSQLVAEGRRFKVVLVGDGPLRHQVETMIKHLELGEHVEITGWATNAQVQQSILNAQVMVVPSFAEGLPVVVMEALALGRPVLATYIAGMAELVEPGVTGWLIPAGSAEYLANAMRVAMDSSMSTLINMGKAGAIKVAQNHNIDTEAAKMRALFESYF
jgi:colanic acid/amylovoran biosynthesis glycosyltransferase